MITPYTVDDKIDYDGVLKIMEWYASEGVAGIFAVCQSSEMHFLSRDERLKLAKFVISNAPEGLGIIASGHVAKTMEEQIDEAKEIIDAGVESHVFISNRFAKEDESEDVARGNIEKLISAIPVESFGIYECPSPYKRLISPELLKWCADTGRFSFLKDTCCDPGQLKLKIDAVKGKLFKFCNGLFGRLRGGTAQVNVAASLIFSGMTGSAIADASGIGLMEIEQMKKEGYDPEFSCALTAASATVGPIFPPSIPMVIYAMLSGASIGKLFMGGMIPGVFLSFMLMIYVGILSIKRKYHVVNR